MWEIFTLIDKDLDESDEEISHLPYHELISKGQVAIFFNKISNSLIIRLILRFL